MWGNTLGSQRARLQRAIGRTIAPSPSLNINLHDPRWFHTTVDSHNLIDARLFHTTVDRHNFIDPKLFHGILKSHTHWVKGIAQIIRLRSYLEDVLIRSYSIEHWLWKYPWRAVFATLSKKYIVFDRIIVMRTLKGCNYCYKILMMKRLM